MSAARRSSSGVSRSRPVPRSQQMAIIHGILVIVIVVVILQLWLLTATMNAYLGGDDGLAAPAALASLVCFGLNAGLLWYLHRLHR